MGELDGTDGPSTVPSGDEEVEGGLVHAIATRILGAGLDGVGPLDPASEVAQEALAASGGDVEAAARRVARRHLAGGVVGGFATGVGGFVTMPIALPVNVVEFYVQAARMVGAIAVLRGHDLADPAVRTAVGLTLVGSEADDVLKVAGVGRGPGRLASTALRGISPTARLMVNKALGFRLLRGVGLTAFSRLGRGIPLAGGAIGGGIDGVMMKRIADHAMREFPRTG